MASIPLTHVPHHGLGPASPQTSSPDTSGLSLQSSFRVDTSFSQQTPEREKHPKGKRKRTTSRDKATLEAAYGANPKPDKAARLDIVQRVSLNEKEVQIWFQNRRQNDRRKSRPLSPQEIAALRYGGVPAMSSENTPYSLESSLIDTRSEDEGIAGLEKPHMNSQDASSPSSLAQIQSSSSGFAEPMHRPHSNSQGTEMPSSQTSDLAADAHDLSKSTSESVGYLSNRWHLGNSFSTPSTQDRHADDSFRYNESFSSAASSQSSPASVLPPPSASSQFRLSLSLEGKAEVVPSQLSPSRSSQDQLPADSEILAPVRPNRTLHRSLSALPGVTLPPISTLTAHLPPKPSRGRSRDVHAWESCCDAETRDELTLQAENESSGSAVAAITLLRSSSSSTSLNSMVHGGGSSPSNVLQPNSARRNTPPGRPSSRGGVSKRTKLTRVNSSIARLPSQQQSKMVSVVSAEKDAEAEAKRRSKEQEAAEQKTKPEKSSLSLILSPSGGDSDKENWSPDAEGCPKYREDRHPSPGPMRSPSKVMASSRGSPLAGRGGTNPRRRVLGPSRGNPLGPNKPNLMASRANTAPLPLPRGSQRGSHKNTDVSVAIFDDGGDDVENEGGEPNRKPVRRNKDDVERFMGSAEVSPSKKGDMDCIAGLLSLSQGNWR